MIKTGKRLISSVLLLVILMQVFSFSVGAAGQDGDHVWDNGSTREYVYSTVASCNAQGGDYIGYISPYSYAMVWGYYAGLYIVMYKTDSGDNKVGFVKYNGGNTNPYWWPTPFKNGPSNTPVYSSSRNALAGTNSIGYVDANDECTNVMSFTEGYTIVLYSIGYTAKVGLVMGKGV